MPSNLYRSGIPIPLSGVLDLRIFLFHGHDYPTPRYFNIMLNVQGLTSAQVSNHVFEHKIGRSGLIPTNGTCCADAQLISAELEPHPNNPALPPFQDVLLAQYQVNQPINLGGLQNQYACAVHEFTVTTDPGQFSTLRLRTSISDKATKRGNWGDKVLDAAIPHVRGSWPYSDIQLSSGEPIDLAAGPTSIALEIGAASGLDTLMFEPRPLDEGATINKGLYGVNATYTVPFTNSEILLTQFHIDCYLRARNVGANYFGAVNVVPSRIPQLNNASPTENACLLASGDTAPDFIPIFIVPNATAAGCGTPVDLSFEWEEI